MDGDYSLILRLDEDFKNGLGIINPFISGLRTQNFVRLCRLWIDKLIHCAPHERKIRNIYLEQLCRHAEQHILGPPFNCPPSEGPLQVIPQQFLLRAGVVCRRQSRTEAETTSWSDVSDTSCLTSTSIFQEDDYDDDEHDEEVKQIRKVVSTTSTTGAETTVSGSARSAHFKRRNKATGVFVKTKSKRTLKKQQNLQDSNEDLPFKDCYETPVRPKSAVSKRKGKIKRTVITDMVVKSNEDPEKICASTKKKTFKSKEAVVIDSRKDLRAESEEALIEVYSKKTVAADKDKLIEFESKIKDLQKELEDLRDQNDCLRNQLREERNNRDDMAVQQESLKTEVLSLREKLTAIENLKHSIEEEHNLIVNESLGKISVRVDDAISKNEKLESILISLGNEMKRRDNIKTENFQKIQKVFCEQLKALEQDYADKMKNSHAQTVQTYEASMGELRKELSKKNKEISRLEKQLQEQCARMRTEVGSIKQEIEKSSKESEARLNMKINVYKAKIIKLIKYVRKVTEFYEQKIETLQKSKDMELWVQKLNIGSDASSGRKQELEDIISALEEKFRKQLSDATKLNFHQKEQTLKLKEITAELENGTVNRDVQE